MQIRFIKVPYDTARYEERMGCGPARILAAGAAARLQACGHAVDLQSLDLKSPFPAEVDTAFDVMAGVAKAVRRARAEGRFPFVLAGNCNTTVGAVSGLRPQRVGVVWFDGHADLETPETTTSGFIDGMGLAILTGHCWPALAQRISGFAPVAGEDVILAGASDIAKHEHALRERSGMGYLSDRVLNGAEGAQRLGEALDRLRPRIDGIHLHVDLDVHDAEVARANHFRPPGGLSPGRLRERWWRSSSRGCRC